MASRTSNRGQFFAIDMTSGKTLWTSVGRQGDNASMILAGPLLLASTTGSELIVARVNPARFDEVKRYTHRGVRRVGASSRERPHRSS